MHPAPDVAVPDPALRAHDAVDGGSLVDAMGDVGALDIGDAFDV